MAFNDLLRLVPIDDGVETFKCSTAHYVSNPLFLNSKTLDLVVDVEKEAVVSGRIVTWTN